MKLKKILGLTMSVLALSSVFALAACGGEEGGGGQNSYVMEAEYVSIADVKGSGLSSDQSGYDLIYGDGTDAQKDKGWSSGYYVGYTYTTEFAMDFVFTADKDATATIVIRLGSELGNITLTPDSFEIQLNGTPIKYGSMYIENSASMAEMKFTDKTVTSSAALKQGENKITLKVLPNEFKNGSTGGPTIDCIKIQTEAALQFEENKDNPDNRGGY